jgi:hypothetical protein
LAGLPRTLTALLALGLLLGGLGACPRSGGDAGGPQVTTPPGGPRFELTIPPGYTAQTDLTRDLLSRAWLALHDTYQVEPPYQWRVIYETQAAPGFPDLPSPPVYEGAGTLRLGVDYLVAPSGDERWINAQMLGTMEGLAEVFDDYLGLGNTQVENGLAAMMARNVAPGMWAGLRAAEMNAYIIRYQDEEDRNVKFWLDNQRPPEGAETRVLDRQRQLLLWSGIAERGSADMWPRVFRDLQRRGLPLTKVTSPAEGNRELIKTLRRVTGQDFTELFQKYGFEV